MSKNPLSLTIADLSGFAKSLRAGLEQPPSHLEMLGLIARAAGFRNYQHLRARLAETPAEPVDDRAVTRAARFFDAEGLFTDWPGKTGVQHLCLWVIWAQIPAGPRWSEREISQRIDDLCRFRDAAQIRRAMIGQGLLTGACDGSDYARVERRPPAEARALIARVRQP
ncbi:DUF2087 domain-containing protein [Antarctobacter jejuensis]|uniref:DUF2087 domain-containing protein n=1 Tax=Antarctobacter jejuensis TaxID=1439938 RepID=UPI003FCF3E0B